MGCIRGPGVLSGLVPGVFSNHRICKVSEWKALCIHSQITLLYARLSAVFPFLKRMNAERTCDGQTVHTLSIHFTPACHTLRHFTFFMLDSAHSSTMQYTVSILQVCPDLARWVKQWKNRVLDIDPAAPAPSSLLPAEEDPAAPDSLSSTLEGAALHRILCSSSVHLQDKSKQQYLSDLLGYHANP